MNGTRQPAVAGMFYPDDADDLRQMVRGFLDKAKDVKIKGRLRGLVVPHAGYTFSGPVAAYAYRLLSKSAEKNRISRIMLVGPSHYAGFFGAAEAGFDHWLTPLGSVKTGSVRGLVKGEEARKTLAFFPQAHETEHCLEVQLPFLQTVLGDFEAYPLLTGDVLPDALARALLPALDDRTIFIASSDLSHYHPYAKAVQIDSNANKFIPKLDIENTGKSVEACGKTGIMALMHIAKRKGWKGILLDYRNSGDTSGDKSAVVGYGAYAFYEG